MKHLKKLKYMCLGTLFFVLAIALTACGGGNDDTLRGTYLSEDEPGFVLYFGENTFRMTIPLQDMMEDDMELPDLEMSGTYSIDQGSRIINLTVNEAALERDIRQIMDAAVAQDPDVQEMLADPEMAELMEAMLGGMIDGLVGVLMDEILAEADGLSLGFERDFSRLYDVDTVWVRQ